MGRRLLVLVALLLAALGGAAAPASAHAALTASTPAQGSVVARSPSRVSLTFSEGVAMNDDSVRVLDPAGHRVDRGRLLDLGHGSTVSRGKALPAKLPHGTYTVAWQAISADSHPVSGAFTFSVGAPSKTSAAVPHDEAGGGPVGALYQVARYLAYAGFVLLVGGAVFVLACRPAAAGLRPVQRVIATGWAVMTATTLAMLLLRFPYTGSGHLADALDLGGLQQTVSTKPGAALLARLLLLATAALFMAVLFGAYARAVGAPGQAEAGDAAGDDTTGSAHVAGAAHAAPSEAAGVPHALDEARPAAVGPPGGGRRRELGRGLAWGGAIIAAGLAATWATAEHASTGLQTGVAMPVDVLHLLAVATWLGGLTALLVSLRGSAVVEAAAVRRFSRLAFGSVLVLVVTGVYQSWRQVGSWHGLTDTAYGRLLLVKVALVALLVGLAALSRRWTRRLADGPAAEPPGAGTGTEPPAPAVVPATRPAPDARPTPASVAAGPAAERDTPAADTSPAGNDTAADTANDDAPQPAPPDPERAAQLERQRAAVASARRRKLRDADPVRAGLRRSVLLETVVAAVLLAVATALSTTEPARTQDAVQAAQARDGGGARPGAPLTLTIPFDTGGPRGKGTAHLTLDPGRSGSRNTLHVTLTNPSGATMDVPEVRVSLTQRARRLGPLPVRVSRVGAGHWSAAGVQIPVPGTWQLALVVRTSTIDEITEYKNVQVS